MRPSFDKVWLPDIVLFNKLVTHLSCIFKCVQRRRCVRRPPTAPQQQQAFIYAYVRGSHREEEEAEKEYPVVMLCAIDASNFARALLNSLIWPSKEMFIVMSFLTRRKEAKPAERSMKDMYFT